MRRIAIVIVTALGSIALSPAAHAGGSIAFVDALGQLDVPDGLIDDVARVAADQDVEVDRIICTATRLGRHFAALGGARIGPYECLIGKKTILINTKPEFRDAKDEPVSADESDLAQRATKVDETEVTWTWR